MASESYELPTEDNGRRWRLPLTWSLLFAVGWLLYEVTTQPAIGVAAICLKFGWSDFHTALWLRRNDPYRQRGRTCFWMHVGCGFWKTAVTGLVPMFALPFLLEGFGVRQQAGRAPAALPNTFVVACLTVVGGFLLSAFTTNIAVICAWRHGIPLWLNRAIHRDRRQNIWPPLHALSGQPNHIGRLLLAMMTVYIFTILMVGLIWLAMTAPGPEAAAAGNQRDAPGALFGGILVGGLIAAALSILLGREWLLRKIAARSPAECWPDTLLAKADSDAQSLTFDKS